MMTLELPLIVFSLAASPLETDSDKGPVRGDIFTAASAQKPYALQRGFVIEQDSYNPSEKRADDHAQTQLSKIVNSQENSIFISTDTASPLPYEPLLGADNDWLNQNNVTFSAQWPAPIIIDIGAQDSAAQQSQTGSEDLSEEDLPPAIVVDGIELDTVDQFSLETFEFVESVDLAVVEPVIDFYRDAVPSPLRQASQNFVRNLGEPINILNYLLQLKPGKAIETAGRFLINSTLGIGGLIDIAGKPGINLPYRYNGFANTLGYYGVKPGRYLYLPFIGSTTPRDLIGNTLDNLLLPVVYGPPVNDPIFAVSVGAVSALNQRLDNDAMIDRLRLESADIYGDSRDAYLLLRENDIRNLRGLPPLSELPTDAKAQPDRDVTDTSEKTADNLQDDAKTLEIATPE